MTFAILRSSSLALMLCAIPAIAGSQYTRMVESKPVVTNGLEFIAAVEDEWVGYKPNYGQASIQVQLFIHNVTDKPLLFPTFDTFGIIIKDGSGKDIGTGWGRDGTLATKSVIIDPGARYCLSRRAELKWNADGKSRTFIYYDGTGSESTYGPLTAGRYTLSFWCESSGKSVQEELERWRRKHSEKAPLRNAHPQIANWIGKAVTKEVAFKIIDP